MTERTVARPPAWVFDIDGTLVDAISGSRLRMGVNELFGALQREGLAIVAWSAGGSEYAEAILHRHGVADGVGGYFAKSLRRADQCWCVEELRRHYEPVLFVDDMAQEIPASEAAAPVAPFIGGGVPDTALADLAAAHGIHVEIGG